MNRVMDRIVARVLCAALASTTAALMLAGAAKGASRRHHPAPVPSPVPVVVSLHELAASHAAAIVRGFYPKLRVRVDAHANAVIAIAPPDEADAIRTILQGIDVRNPAAANVDAEVLHNAAPSAVIQRLRSVFPTARFFVAPNRTLITVASPDDLEQIKTVIAAIDTPLQTPTPRPRYAPQAVRVQQGNVRTIARAVAHQVNDVAVAISGSVIVLRGPPDDVAHAKDLIAQLDVPQRGQSYATVYRLRYADAASTASLLEQSFPDATVAVNTDLNALTITASTEIQDRIAQAIAQLDVAPAGAPGASGGAAPSMTVVSLNAAMPGSNSSSTTASDLAQTVQQALQQSAPDLHVTVPPNSTQLILTGSPYSIELAEQLIAKLDVMPPMVVLDTEILEVDEGVAKQLGFQFPGAMLSTTFSETTPQVQSNGLPGRLLGLMPLTRTPLSLVAELNFLIANNEARILEDPQITTFSGHTATIRAGETINVLTTTGGGAGVVPTSQISSFQTGVTLDITPVVNADGLITIALHPTVNSVAGVSAAGVPNVQTRDTSTTVGLRDGQTLVIGGLIEDDSSREVQRIPFLGYLPLIGFLFRDTNVQHTRNELLISITPHVIPEHPPTAPEATPNPTPVPITLPTPVTVPLPTPAPWPMLPPAPRAQLLPTPVPVAISPPEPTPAPTVIPSERNAPALSDVGGSATPHPLVSPSPVALPSAFSQTDVYTFGTAPANNYAAPNAAPQIFFVQVQPTVIGDGEQMTISAITTTNVTRLTFGSNTMLPEAQLRMVAPGKWQSTFTFSSAGLPVGQSNVQMTLTATTAVGGMVAVPVPLSVVQP